MYLHKVSLCLWMLALVSGNLTASEKDLGKNIKVSLGQPLVNYVGSVVSTDGDGLPKGSGSVAEGKRVFEAKCVACHGPGGEQPGNQLVGGIGSLPTMRPLKTVTSYWPYATTLYDYVARAMPYNEEKSLSPDDVYAVTAYVLNLSQIVDDATRLNQDNLMDVVMPNRDGFIELID
jgi:cytochrome c